MAAEDIGAIYPTKIPGYEDPADIQAALRLFHYGSSTYDITNTDLTQLPPASIAAHLHGLREDITEIQTLGTGSDYLSTAPSLPHDGYIWMDATSSASGQPSYAAAVYSPSAPTVDLVDGLLWVDKDANPPRAYIYDAGTEEWVAVTEIPGIVENSGDMIYGTAADDIAILSIGNEGDILKVVSGLPSWEKQKEWVLKAEASLSGSAISVSSLTGERLFIVLKDWSHDNNISDAMLTINFNNDMGPNYVNTGGLLSASSLHSPVFSDSLTHDLTVSVDLANTSSSLKPVATIADSTTSGPYFGYYKNPAEITSVQISLSPASNFDGGTYQVWSYE
jgi:hypothetical protein